MAWYFRGFIYVLGLLILALGISLTIVAGLGTGPWPALYVGLFHAYGLTVGAWTIFISLILVAINSSLLKEVPHILNILSVLILGAFIDYWLLYVLSFITTLHIMMAIILLLFGALFTALGIAIYLQSKLPTLPIDGLMIAIHRRFSFKIGRSKTTAELIALLFAFLFSGPIGIGTLFIALAIGPMTQRMITVVNDRYNKSLKRTANE